MRTNFPLTLTSSILLNDAQTTNTMSVPKTGGKRYPRVVGIDKKHQHAQKCSLQKAVHKPQYLDGVGAESDYQRHHYHGNCTQ